MRLFQIYYMKPEWFRDGICGDKPDIKNLDKTHQLVTITRGNDLEDIFDFMQGHNWSKNGEAADLIEKLGLHHTSMSVGDIVIDDERNVHLCCSFDWENLGKQE